MSKKDLYVKLANQTTEHGTLPFILPSLNYVSSGNYTQGIPRGKMTQLIGKESSGKSTLGYHLISQAQKLGDKCMILDVERSFTVDYALKLGIDVNTLLIAKPDTAEEGLDIVEHYIKNEGLKLLLFDSISFALPASELEKDYTEAQKMASSAIFINRFCKRIVPILDNYGATVIVINQWRANFSTLSRVEHKPFGGSTLPHAIALTLDLVRIENKDTHAVIQVSGKKNKTGGNERLLTKITYRFGEGLDIFEDVLTLCTEHGIVQKRGTWLEWNGLKAQGADNARLVFNLEQLQKELYGKLSKD